LRRGRGGSTVATEGEALTRQWCHRGARYATAWATRYILAGRRACRADY